MCKKRAINKASIALCFWRIGYRKFYSNLGFATNLLSSVHLPTDLRLRISTLIWSRYGQNTCQNASMVKSLWKDTRPLLVKPRHTRMAQYEPNEKCLR